MLTERSLGSIAVFFIAALLVVGGLITILTTQTVEAAVDIGQTRSQTNICGFLVTPVICTNVGINSATITPAPVETQNIDITGTQNIDQTNICDDDDGSECLNTDDGIGNMFSLVHNQGADVSISFEQDINQVNTCLLFDIFCGNGAANFFGIGADFYLPAVYLNPISS